MRPLQVLKRSHSAPSQNNSNNDSNTNNKNNNNKDNSNCDSKKKDSRQLQTDISNPYTLASFLLGKNRKHQWIGKRANLHSTSQSLRSRSFPPPPSSPPLPQTQSINQPPIQPLTHPLTHPLTDSHARFQSRKKISPRTSSSKKNDSRVCAFVIFIQQQQQQNPFFRPLAEASQHAFLFGVIYLFLSFCLYFSIAQPTLTSPLSPSSNP